MPRAIWFEKMLLNRKADIVAAINRFHQANQPIPDNWLDELKEIEHGLKGEHGFILPTPD